MKNKQTFALRQLITGQWDGWLLALLLGVVTVIATIGLLMLSGWFLSAAALAGLLALGAHTFNYMVPAAIIRVFAMLRTAGRYGELMVSHHAIFKLLQQLRVRFFNQFAKLLPRQLPSDVRSAHAMHRLTHDIDVLDEFVLRVVSPWVQAKIAVLMIAAFIVLWLPLVPAWRYGLVVLLMLASLIVPWIAALRGIKEAKYQHQLAEERRVSLLEPMSVVTHLLLWRRWQGELAKFFVKDQAYEQTQRQNQRTRGMAMLIVQWGLVAVVIAVLYGVGQSASTSVNIPLILAAVLGVLGLTEVVVPLAANYLALGNSLAAKNRLNELLIAEPIETPTVNIDQIRQSGQPLQMAISELNGKMPSAVVGFSDINTTVVQGKPLLITGASGAGKSTLLQVLANEVMPSSGSIRLNGVDWQAIDWQVNGTNQFGYLGQQIDIFDQTLAQNLRLGKTNASDDELWQVLDKVALKDWAANQPEGLNTALGEYGMAVSGGQARRIALARLLLTPKTVLMLDEPFAGLDATNRERLWQHLVERQRDGLLIVVTHQVWQEPNSVESLHLAEPVVVA